MQKNGFSISRFGWSESSTCNHFISGALVQCRGCTYCRRWPLLHRGDVGRCLRRALRVPALAATGRANCRCCLLLAPWAAVDCVGIDEVRTLRQILLCVGSGTATQFMGARRTGRGRPRVLVRHAALLPAAGGGETSVVRCDSQRRLAESEIVRGVDCPRLHAPTAWPESKFTESLLGMTNW